MPLKQSEQIIIKPHLHMFAGQQDQLVANYVLL